MRMRNIKSAYHEIKAKDPDSALTMYSIRQKVITGEIPSIWAGRKLLINMDLLEEYFDNPRPKVPIPPSGSIRRITE